MPTNRPEIYHRERTQLQLRKLLATPAEVQQQLQAIESAFQASFLPYHEVAEPYLQLVAAGHLVTAEQLVHLMEWAVRLDMTWYSFVGWYVLPFAQQRGRGLVSELNQIFFHAAA